MSKLHIKKGDTVYVNSGEDKGKTGRVLKVLVDKNRAIVEGINMVSKSTKPNAKNPQGGIVKQEASIHISNLNPVDPKTGKATRVGRKVSVKIGDQVVFSNEDFSGITGLGNKIAFKGGTYSSAVTDVYLKNIHYTGQAEAKTYAVTGKVQDQDGKAISNATVTVEGQSVRTGEDGSYSLTLATGNYEMTVARDGYETVVENIAVTDADTVLDTVSLVKSAEVEPL